MIDYGFEAVRNSLKAATMTVSPNRLTRAMGRTAFRTFNAVPALKKRVFARFGDA